MAGKHRRTHPLVVSLRTTGGIVAGATVVGLAAVTTQAFAGEAGSADRPGASLAAAAAQAKKPGGDVEEGGNGKGGKDGKDGKARASGERASSESRKAKRAKPTADDAIELAKSQVGISENGSGQTKFQDWYMSTERARETVARDGGSIKAYDDAAWCSMFISWIGDRIGFSDQLGKDAWTVEHAKWFKENGRWGTEPRPGAIVFFDWGGGKSLDDIVHVGMVIEKAGRGKVRTVEGNTSNAVKIRERSADQIVGYGYPDYAK
ncbi:CHAP domain-containing protein [Spirillospora sp. NPDC029432]|uniref:CHAP domain-containing protein n=1 Tax=Spirillospora sp. NPDC029432 TaxID=3154599 RepID=UPI0034561FFC